jgi:hypothetical protein
MMRTHYVMWDRHGEEQFSDPPLSLKVDRSGGCEKG